MSIPNPARAVPGRRRKLLGTFAGSFAVVAATLVSAPVAAQAALAPDPILIGASGEVAALSKNVGAPLASHIFAQLDGPVKSGRFINIQPNVSWRTVANARSGSATYKDLVRWADGLKGRSGPILMSFSHEPEGKSSRSLGTNVDFIAAWRRVHNFFTSRGVKNVEYTWTMTSNSFRVPARDDRYGPKWYPGDTYVDNVATAAYNYFDCGEGRGKWLSLANRAQDPLAFAKAKHKPYVLAEWASQASSRRAQWLKDAHAWLLANKSFIRGAFYYQTPYLRGGCRFQLTTSAEYQAFGTMAKDRANFGV